MQSVTPRPNATPFRADALAPTLAPTLAPALAGPVLVAADGTAATPVAARAALYVAERLHTRVDVVATLEPLPIYAFGFDALPVPMEADDARREALRASVVAQLAPVLGPPDTWQLDVRYGSPGRAIADLARERGSGLVVVGSGEHELADRLFGEEVSLQVVRHASCPVLAVTPTFRLPAHHAVVGIDFGAASVRAALAALALLDADADGGARLTLVHVRSPFEATYPILGSWASDYDAQVAEFFLHVREMVRPYAPSGVTIETRTRFGAVPATVLEVARESGGDFVAVGTHGPGWVERLFVGSVSTGALRSKGTTVLVTPAPSARERVRLELGVFGETILTTPEEWPAALDAFSRRNTGRPARLEIAATEDAAPVPAATGFHLRGVAFDPHDAQVEVMLDGGEGRARHLTHMAGDVRAIEILADPEGARDLALIIDHKRGHAVLTLLDDAPAGPTRG